MAARAKRVRSAGIVLAAMATMAGSLGVFALAGSHGDATAPATRLPIGSAPPSASWNPSQTPTSSGSAGLPPNCLKANIPVDNGPSPPPGGLSRQDTPNTGPLYYLQAPGTAKASTLPLVVWTPGQATVKTVLHLPVNAWVNANVSPNHRWVSWVTTGGDLHLSALDGSGNDRVLAHSIDGYLLEPVWSNDSSRLLVRDTSSGKVGTVAVPDGTFTALKQDLPGGARHAVWAADGSAIAYVTANGGITVADTDGTNRRNIAVADTDFAKAGRKAIGLGSLSTTSSGMIEMTVAVTDPGGQPEACRSLVTNTEVRAGGTPLAGSGPQVGLEYRQVQTIYRAPAFTNVARDLSTQHTLGLIGGNGEYLGAVNEPSSLANYLLLG